MNALLRAQGAELLKVKRTLGLWMVLLAPLAVALLVGLQMGVIATHAKHALHLTPSQAWLALDMHMFALWAVFVLPLFVTVQTAWLAALEHGNQQWKHLLALPLPRYSHYLVKLTTLALMVLCSYVLLLLLIAPTGWILAMSVPQTGITGPPVIASLIVSAACSFAACCALMALQTWIALRWRSFNVTICVGFVATVAGMLIARSKYGIAFPWSMPSQAFGDDAHRMVLVACIGVVGGVLVAALGLYDLLRRDNP